MANNTEQKRIATALETMAQIEPNKENNTEQQRIATAVEAIAVGGGGGIVVPTYTISPTETQGQFVVTDCDMTYEEILVAVNARKCPMCYIVNTANPAGIYDMLSIHDSANMPNVPQAAVSVRFGRSIISSWNNNECHLEYYDLIHKGDDSISYSSYSCFVSIS